MDKNLLIQQVTEKQMELLNESIKFWDDHIIACKELDKEKITKLVNKLYQEVDTSWSCDCGACDSEEDDIVECTCVSKEPKIIFVNSPMGFFQEKNNFRINDREAFIFGCNSKGASGMGYGTKCININNRAEKNTLILDYIRKNSLFCQIQYNSHGCEVNHDNDDLKPEVAIYSDFINKLNGEKKEEISEVKQIILAGAFSVICYTKTCIIQAGPKEIKIDENGKLHNIYDYAVDFHKDYAHINAEQYYIHGKKVCRKSFTEIVNNEKLDFYWAFIWGELEECCEIITQNENVINKLIPTEVNVNDNGILINIK